MALDSINQVHVNQQQNLRDEIMTIHNGVTVRVDNFIDIGVLTIEENGIFQNNSFNDITALDAAGVMIIIHRGESWNHGVYTEVHSMIGVQDHHEAP